MSNTENTGRLVIYRTEDGKTDIDVIVREETVWMTQKQMAELFQTTSQNITMHLKNIFKEQELDESSTCKDFLQVQREGNRTVKRPIIHYNLDAIISVGYRVSSQIGTRFRQWATGTLKEYVIKGFAMDDARLSGDKRGYFEELYERVRRIRTSEKNYYEKIKDIFKETSTDYDPNSEAAKEFFASMQNLFHYASHEHTAAELIVERANADKPKMGLTNWSAEDISLSDVKTAKNYLTDIELKRLELLSEGFLSFAESKALDKATMNMRMWAEKFIDFLRFYDRPVLEGPGKISSEDAKAFAMKQYAIYSKRKEEEIKRLEAYLNKEIPEEIDESKDIQKFDKELTGLLNTPPPQKNEEGAE